MYTAKNFEHLLGTEGFSDALLRNHFGLYEGYVKNTNVLADRLSALAKEEGVMGVEYNELKRRFGWEYNGMRMHELYFGNMQKGGTPHDPESALCQKMKAQWGSCETWAKDFKATGAMRGIGWVVLAYDAEADQLFNLWINEHDGGHLVGAEPLLVMDVFEHAFVLDYGMKRADYIASFWGTIDWKVVMDRFAQVA
jgi:Fe-Mn family superoxide dismutase